ncbi:hypothetical protein [Nocardia pseudobrasiliensis]|uniref:Uncharacterized protein n=1 Tax=Nocardia pseudobrasiliensis TaxID=45979 RepID=A0A370ICL5_9NOCA|nr:hypothetical protein [Nocardia pseudobrasiliensis]RDI68469.1 hypothetical protein DFR76_1014 [Nocardia pseudobrasiliensis]
MLSGFESHPPHGAVGLRDEIDCGAEHAVLPMSEYLMGYAVGSDGRAVVLLCRLEF